MGRREAWRRLAALLLLAGSGSPCGGCISGTLASGGPVSAETSDSVENKGDSKTQ